MRAMAFYWQGVALLRHGPEGSYYCDTVTLLRMARPSKLINL